MCNIRIVLTLLIFFHELPLTQNYHSKQSVHLLKERETRNVWENQLDKLQDISTSQISLQQQNYSMILLKFQINLNLLLLCGTLYINLQHFSWFCGFLQKKYHKIMRWNKNESWWTGSVSFTIHLHSLITDSFTNWENGWSQEKYGLPLDRFSNKVDLWLPRIE